PYKHDTATPWKRSYLPDFYLPEHDLYLEHFGINRDGKTAPNVNGARYREAMDWKRKLHRDHGTVLLETYSWMREEGTLTRELERQLRDHGAEPKLLSKDEIAAIVEQANTPFAEFLGLIDTFRALFQGQGASWEALQAKAQTERERAFLAVFQPVFAAYRARLAETRTIDFDDMINAARAHVQAGQFTSPYTHIIIDEFQDISETRLGLLMDLRAQVPHARLFAVGDDWQSIYRFAGSDVGIMTSFVDHVGPAARVDLDIAYRYPQRLVDVSSRFVMKNPAQLRKALRAASGDGESQPVTIIQEEAGEENAAAAAIALAAACDEVVARAAGQPASVLILGRYNALDDHHVRGNIVRLAQQGIAARFLTVHKAKGQEADFVIVPGLKRGARGFPSEIADDPVLQLVLSPGEAFPHSEERRLLYVALTRARRHVFLIVPAREPSDFVTEDLDSDELREYVRRVGASPRPTLVCPRCKGRTIVRRDGKGSSFWACEHFPLCHGRLDPCPRCQQGVMVFRPDAAAGQEFECMACHYQRPACARCGEGFMVERNGRRGPFLGCSMFARGGCEYTQDGHDVAVRQPAGVRTPPGAPLGPLRQRVRAPRETPPTAH
ncbi:MAG: UvrD-helicase domain-containing protein, partial [Thermomicrobiales bacterium]